MKDKILYNAYPATKWTDATPIGNGKLGAAVYGAVYDERILINHEVLYDNFFNKDIPDVSFGLSEIRKLMDEKRYCEANSYYTDLLTAKGYFARKGQFYPAFDLHYLLGVDCAFTDYSRKLDMRTGVSEVKYKENGLQTVREAFVSQKNGFMVLHIEKQQPFEVTFALEQHDLIDMVDYNGNAVEKCQEFFSVSEDKYIYSKCKTKAGLEYSGIFSIVETDGTLFCNGKDKNRKIDMSGTLPLYNYIKISNATYVTAVLDVSPENKSFEQLKNTLSIFDGKTYAVLKDEHTAAFSQIFDRVTLDLCDEEENLSIEQQLLNAYNGNVNNQLIEKMADFGRYLLISSSLGCTLPANLQGVWNGNYSPAWECTFFNNENIEMAYWQALTGNLQETLLPLFDLYERFKDDYRMNAKNLYGCRGLLLPLFMDNQSGKKDNLQPHVLHWTGSSAWISAMYYDYYLFTGDTEFLLNRAYPFMKESALFYEDFYVLDENGKLKSYPSNSPENRANGDFEGAGEMSVCINATMDFALLKELLSNLVNVSQQFGLNDGKVEKWEDMLSRIPEYRINDDGALCEWLHDDFKDNYKHRHQSHIYPLFPGFEVTKESDKALFDAIKTAVDKRLVVGIKEQTGWSFAHMANIFARLGNGEKTKECLDLLLRFCTGENLFTYHNDWRNMGVTLKYMIAKQAPFQIDANMGFTAAVYEMLLYSNTKMLKILPALPKEFKKGKIKGIIARGGYKVDIEWQNNDVEVCITAARDSQIDVGLTNGRIVESNACYSPSSYGDDFVCMNFKKGCAYRLKYSRV